MLVLGIVLLVLGALTGIGILYSLGEVLLVIGVLLLVLGYFGGPERTYGGRRYWY